MIFQRAHRVFRLIAVIALGCAVLAVRSGAMSVRPPAFAELVEKAEAIVHVTVESTRGQWDTTPTGQRVIHTYVTCRVQETLKGAPAEHLELRFLGGDVGKDHLVVADMPKFDAGGEYVLFIAGNHQAFCPLVHVMHGSYSVVRDSGTGNPRVLRHNGEPLQETEGVARPFAAQTFVPEGAAMTLAEFRAAIIAQQNAGAISHAR